MSSIFSDPGWSRGRTLLQGELIEYDDAPTNTRPTAGNEVVGSVKVFQDVNPVTGVRNSNRLVYCVAARYTGSTNLTASDEIGKVFAFRTTSNVGNLAPAMTEFSAVATTTDVNTNGFTFGVLDEYLTGTVRPNDIVWLVVKGPTQIRQTAAAIGAGRGVEVSGTSGQIAQQSSGRLIGQHIGTAATAATANLLPRINLYGDAATGV